MKYSFLKCGFFFVSNSRPELDLERCNLYASCLLARRAQQLSPDRGSFLTFLEPEKKIRSFVILWKWEDGW